jgi:hypothetical protein
MEAIRVLKFGKVPSAVSKKESSERTKRARQFSLVIAVRFAQG